MTETGQTALVTIGCLCIALRTFCMWIVRRRCSHHHLGCGFLCMCKRRPASSAEEDLKADGSEEKRSHECLNVRSLRGNLKEVLHLHNHIHRLLYDRIQRLLLVQEGWWLARCFDQRRMMCSRARRALNIPRGPKKFSLASAWCHHTSPIGTEQVPCYPKYSESQACDKVPCFWAAIAPAILSRVSCMK